MTDATMTPVEHAEKLYKRAAKQRRGAEKLLPLIDETEKLLAYVGEVQESVTLLQRWDLCRLSTVALVAERVQRRTNNNLEWPILRQLH